MVVLQVKRGSENCFLYETKLTELSAAVIADIVAIFNGRLKVHRICSEIEDLIEHGTMLPPEMIGLTDEQIQELKLKDFWADKCIPSGGFTFHKDPMGRRNGHQPLENMQNVLRNAVAEAKEKIDKKLVSMRVALGIKDVNDVIHLLRGALAIVYPMQLPPHDPIRMEFTNMEDLSGTQASRDIIEPSKAQLWFAGVQILPEKQLCTYIGNNEKTKVIVKINQLGDGPPGREPVLTDQLRRQFMADAHHRQEELRKLEQDDDDQYLNSSWADSSRLKCQVHGLETVKFRFYK